MCLRAYACVLACVYVLLLLLHSYRNMTTKATPQVEQFTLYMDSRQTADI